MVGVYGWWGKCASRVRGQNLLHAFQGVVAHCQSSVIAKDAPGRIDAQGGVSVAGKAVSAASDWYVVTAPSREVLETYVQPRITTFLAQRGLTLSETKTRIVHSEVAIAMLEAL
jgi:hypothetical protein